GAASYNIYRSKTSGGEGSTPLKTGVTATSFTDTGLANGTIYYYQVTAVNSAGGSGKSSGAATTPLVTPDPRNPAFVAQAYLDLLHRRADAGGLDSFVSALNHGLITRVQVALALGTSVEYRSLQIGAIYQSLLHRSADPAALSAFLNFVAQG